MYCKRGYETIEALRARDSFRSGSAMAMSISPNVYVVMSYATTILVEINDKVYLNNKHYSSTTSTIQNACRKAFKDLVEVSNDQMLEIMNKIHLEKQYKNHTMVYQSCQTAQELERDGYMYVGMLSREQARFFDKAIENNMYIESAVYRLIDNEDKDVYVWVYPKYERMSYTSLCEQLVKALTAEVVTQ